MSGSVTLPYELWAIVVSLVEDKHDLVQLCRTNSTIGQIASRQLYRAVHLYDTLPMGRLYRSISKRPNLAHYIVVMEVNVRRLRPKRPPIYTASGRTKSAGKRISFLMPGFMRLLFRLLRAAVDLKILLIDWKLESREIAEAMSIHLGQLPSRLDSLTLRGPPALHILETQHTLQHLSLEYTGKYPRSSIELERPPKDTIPLLRYLASDRPAVARLAQGRPLQEFHLYTQHLTRDELLDCLKWLRMTTCPLRIVELVVETLDSTVFERISTALPDLVALCLQIPEDLSESELLIASQTPDLVRGFEGFRALEKLELHLCCDDPPPTDVRVWDALQQIGRACSSLHTVSVAFEHFEGLKVLPIYIFSRPQLLRDSWIVQRQIHVPFNCPEPCTVSELFSLWTCVGEVISQGYQDELNKLDSICRLM
ncbi:hypothetical protein CALCODRAFT_498063 [Calocera cornea HHB12733]|uniref:F-box domain-containing protein n=1 Tax=Calocera cornea HHB12733 TaxID=1353952 RepID=A0A165EZI4_9BASI|nr:hypothetical protein CALCODRAFT_498063 [Calocera cornea HHB12733]